MRRDWFGNPCKGYEWTELDDLDKGWRIAFGMMIVKEIDEILRKAHYERKYQIVQVKEKYGGLRWYDNGAPREIYDELQRTINKYSCLSENICGHCGRPDVFMTYSGWDYPLCKKCWNTCINDNREYEQVISDKDTGKMANSYTIHRFSENQDITYDISDTAERIRRRYEKRSERSARRLQRLGQ